MINEHERQRAHELEPHEVEAREHEQAHESAQPLRLVPDDELLRRLCELVSRSHGVEADLVAHIGEVDERRLYARFAFPSMYAYCTQALHLPEAEAYRRITVARAAREHEMLLPMLRDGRLHLSGLAMLVALLTPGNRDEVLRRATHASTREIERLVAELKPQPDVRSQIRKLPERLPAGLHQRWVPPSGSASVRVAADSRVSGGSDCVVGSGESLRRGETLGSADRPAPAQAAAQGQEPQKRSAGASLQAPAQLFPGRVAFQAGAPSRRAVVQPLSPGRHKVQFTASDALRAKLERLRALMRSEVPDGDLAALIEGAVTEKLERLEARRFAATRAPRQTLAQSKSAPISRHIPAAVRRAVWKRDGGRCTYVDEQGRRCSERHRLELHHRIPYGMGGDHSLENLSLKCSSHNRYLAERDYGPEAVRKHYRVRTRLCQVSLEPVGDLL